MDDDEGRRVVAAALAFNDAITRQDDGALAGLLHEDHRFVDTEGGAVEGKDASLDTWHGFFSAFPGYRNELHPVRVDDDTVVLEGRSHCRVPELDGPALWRAVVAADGRLTEWRVYDDTPANRGVLGLPVSRA